MDVFDKMFSTFKESAIRLETLSTYKIEETNEYDEYDKYTKGIYISDFANNDWIECLKAWNREGKTIKRLRIVPNKINSYIRYEVDFCFPKNISAQEEISFSSLEDYMKNELSEIANDFWLFDKKYLLKMNYTTDGEYINAELIEDISIVKKYITLYEDLQSKSISYSNLIQQIRSFPIEVEFING